jgi:BASS family bile acid:Na+ symporter
MTETLQTVTNIVVMAFVVLSLLKMGLELKLRELILPLRNPYLVLAALLANFLIAPLLAYGIATLFALQTPHATGLILLGSAAGAPFLPKLAQLAQGDVPYSVALMLLLTVGTILFLPLALPLLIPGVQVNPWHIARSLLLTMLLPLILGMVLHSRLAGWGEKLRPILGLLSNISLLLALVLLIGLNAAAMAGTIGSGASMAAILFVALTCLAGYLLGGRREEIRRVLGLGTGQRNIAAALVVATGNFTDPQVALMLILATFAGLLPLLAVIFFVRKRALTTIPSTTP